MKAIDFFSENAVPIPCTNAIAPSECVRLMEEYHKHKTNEGKRFVPPTTTEVVEYFVHKTSGSWDDGIRFAEKFIAHYEQTNWHYGKRKMKNWKLAAVSAWDMSKFVTTKTLPNGTFGKGTSVEGFNKLAYQLEQNS